MTALYDAITAGLSALRSLSCPSLLLPPLPSLLRLSSLLISCDGDELPSHLWDLRQLTSLVKLGLLDYFGQPRLQSASVTALFCMSLCCEDAAVPYMASCSRLQHIMLACDDDDAYNIEHEQLPPSAKTIWVGQTEGKVFLEARAAEVVCVRRVKDLTWGSDPAMLEAEYN